MRLSSIETSQLILSVWVFLRVLCWQSLIVRIFSSSWFEDSYDRLLIFFTNETISFYVHDWERYKKRNINTFWNEWWIDSFVLYVFACSFALVDVILNMKMIAYCLMFCFQQSILDAWCAKTKCFNLDIN
jgi:hypothetical protein